MVEITPNQINKNKKSNVDAPIQCGKCKFKAKSHKNLRDHEVCHKKKTAQFECDECGYVAIDKNFLTKHKMVSMGHKGTTLPKESKKDQSKNQEDT